MKEVAIWFELWIECEKEMAWFSGKLDLGNLDLAGAVNKLSESVKNIEKNFDTALGLEEKSDESTSTEGISFRSLYDYYTFHRFIKYAFVGLNFPNTSFLSISYA